MLGTRRSSVTVAASILQKARLINYTRGQVNIEDPKGLEEAAYAAMVQQSSRWNGESSRCRFGRPNRADETRTQNFSLEAP